MERDPNVCRGYRRCFLAIASSLSLLGVLGGLFLWFGLSPAPDDADHGLDTWAVVCFAVAASLVVLSPLAAWYGARAIVARRPAADRGLLVTAARPTAAVGQMAIAGLVLTIGWATPLVPALWRHASPGWWTWQDVLYILLVPVLSAATLVLFVRFCEVCSVAARSVAVLRWSAGTSPSDVSPYRSPMTSREVIVVTEQGAQACPVGRATEAPGRAR